MKREELNNTITIPKQHYVGFQRQRPDELPLGFATPYDTTKAYEKRKSTVDNWSNYGHREWDNVTKTYVDTPKIPPIIVDSIPIAGFKIAESVRRVYWVGGNVVWRIVDPRGYELEISSSNLAKILDCSSVVNGEIMGECVWGRDKAQNVLLPVSSQPYLEAVSNTSRVNKRVPLKEVTIGDTVVLKDSTIGVYAGGFNVVHTIDGSQYVSNGYLHTEQFTQIKRRFVLLVTLTGKEKDFWQYSNRTNKELKAGDSVFMFFSDLHISEVIEKTPEPKNFLAQIREYLPTVRDQYWHENIRFITDKPLKQEDIVYSPVPCSTEELNQVFYSDPVMPAAGDRYITDTGKFLYFRTNYDEGELLSFSWHKDRTAMDYVVPHSSRGSYYNTPLTVARIKHLIDNNKISRVAYNINGELYVP